jgi:hypothetical protein
VHNLLSGSRLQQRRLLNLLRWLGNELQMRAVTCGSERITPQLIEELGFLSPSQHRRVAI